MIRVVWLSGITGLVIPVLVCMTNAIKIAFDLRIPLKTRVFTDHLIGFLWPSALMIMGEQVSISICAILINAFFYAGIGTFFWLGLHKNRWILCAVIVFIALWLYVSFSSFFTI